MTKYQSMLQFNRRLIKAALASPRMEAANLLGIVWSNLEEFAQIRIPREKWGNRIDLIGDFMDVVEAFDSAIMRKFPQMYMENEPDVIPELSKLIESLNDDASAELKTMANEWPNIESCTSIGSLFYGTFYHVVNVKAAMAIADFDQRKSKFHITGSEYGTKLAKYTNNEEKNYSTLLEWLNTQKRNTQVVNQESVIFEFTHQPTLKTQFTYTVVESSAQLVYVYVNYRNPLFIRFNEVAKVILKDAGNRELVNDDGTLRYSLAPVMDNLYDATFEDLDEADDVKHILIRTGFQKEHLLYQTLLDQLVGPKWVEDLCGEWVSFSKKFLSVHGGPDAIEELADDFTAYLHASDKTMHAYLTVYRTGSDYDDINYAFLMMLAKSLKENLHVLIECRARGDESNNARIYQTLKDMGADAHIMAMFRPTKKLHAKIWTFQIRKNGKNPNNYKAINLYSTGNFAEAAQRNYADSVLMEIRDVTDRFTDDTVEFWAGMFGSRTVMEPFNMVYHHYPYLTNLYAKPDAPCLIWSNGGQIRMRVVQDIQRMVDEAHRIDIEESDDIPFIEVKVNHLTDPVIVNALRGAAAAGVEVYAIARTSCFLTTSESMNIEVQSIVGKYLEHDRMFLTGIRHNGDRNDFTIKSAYLMSADFAKNKLDTRVEFMKSVGQETGNLLHWIFNALNDASTDSKSGVFNFTI